MTYAIIARDPATGEMGVACQSQAFAVGSSVSWALPGYGVVATQSMGEPMYGELGLDTLRAGLTASEALTALRSVDPRPERRQVAMVDSYGNVDAYTGHECVAAAGHRRSDHCVALANMARGHDVWDAMIDRFTSTEGSLTDRLLQSLHAGEANGGDIRGQGSAAILVVRSQRTGRPWQDHITDLRVDHHPDAIAELTRLVSHNARYHFVVEAFEQALDGDAESALAKLDQLPDPHPTQDPDLCMWRAVILAAGGRSEAARRAIAGLRRVAPDFAEVVDRMRASGLLGSSFDDLVT